MTDDIITLSHLTRDYGGGRGIFDISFSVKKGEVFGYLGTNGSGKTTTIRHIMGFLKAKSGSVRACGLDPWTQTPELMQSVSYIPGEIAFPSLKTGTEFFRVQAEYAGVHDYPRIQHLIELMELDPEADLKRMSKGMKQKTAIVAALMAEKDVLILDEPTTGLDPLMRENFLDLIREEKDRGHTVFMSSHIFEEIEDVCDRVGIIQDGHLREVLNLSEFRHASLRRIRLRFAAPQAAAAFAARRPGVSVAGSEAACSLPAGEMDSLFSDLSDLNVVALHEEHIGLEEYFMDLYHKEYKDNE